MNNKHGANVGQLTSNETTVSWWKEYFEDLHNSTNTHSEEETELNGLNQGPPITEAEGCETAPQW